MLIVLGTDRLCVDSDVQDLTILDTLFSIYEFGTDHLTNSNNTYTWVSSFAWALFWWYTLPLRLYASAV